MVYSMYMHACVYVCTSMCVYVHIHVYILVCTCVSVCLYVSICVYDVCVVCMCVHIREHVHVCAVCMLMCVTMYQFSPVAQSLSRIWLFVTPSTAAHQASLSITNSQSLLRLMPIKLVMPSNSLITCHPLLLLPSIFPSIRVFSSESVLHIRWPKYWSFSFSISPSNEYSGLISFRWTGWISLQSKGLSRVFSNTTVQMHQFFGAQLSL